MYTYYILFDPSVKIKGDWYIGESDEPHPLYYLNPESVENHDFVENPLLFENPEEDFVVGRLTFFVHSVRFFSDLSAPLPNHQ